MSIILGVISILVILVITFFLLYILVHFAREVTESAFNSVGVVEGIAIPFLGIVIALLVGVIAKLNSQFVGIPLWGIETFQEGVEIANLVLCPFVLFVLIAFASNLSTLGNGDIVGYWITTVFSLVTLIFGVSSAARHLKLECLKPYANLPQKALYFRDFLENEVSSDSVFFRLLVNGLWGVVGQRDSDWLVVLIAWLVFVAAVIFLTPVYSFLFGRHGSRSSLSVGSYRGFLYFLVWWLLLLYVAIWGVPSGWKDWIWFSCWGVISLLLAYIDAWNWSDSLKGSSFR